jgi:hypothetical protein
MLKQFHANNGLRADGIGSAKTIETAPVIAETSNFHFRSACGEIDQRLAEILASGRLQAHHPIHRNSSGDKLNIRPVIFKLAAQDPLNGVKPVSGVNAIGCVVFFDTGDAGIHLEIAYAGTGVETRPVVREDRRCWERQKRCAYRKMLFHYRLQVHVFSRKNAVFAVFCEPICARLFVGSNFCVGIL